MKPLAGIKVLDFSDDLAGPSSALKLADLGAEVLKIESPAGEGGRMLTVPGSEIEGISPLFCAVNRSKEGKRLDLNAEAGQAEAKQLIKDADVVIFSRDAELPLFTYETVREWNPLIIYGEVSGYGPKGAWSKKTAHDLLAQCMTGLPYLNGNADEAPIPLGLPVAELFAGQHLAQGVMAALIRRQKKQTGACIQVSLAESVLDIQFEVFSTFLNDGHQLPQRCEVNNANAYINAPYGVYETKEGFIALALCSIPVLGEVLGCKELLAYTDEVEWATKRDQIKAILKEYLKSETAAFWMEKLEAADIWGAKVLNWSDLVKTDGFQVLEMVQDIKRNGKEMFKTTRCPISINKERFYCDKEFTV
ncbi:MAG: CoA transferase [Lachnospiraceae bacterium]